MGIPLLLFDSTHLHCSFGGFWILGCDHLMDFLFCLCLILFGFKWVLLGFAFKAGFSIVFLFYQVLQREGVLGFFTIWVFGLKKDFSFPF